MAISRLLGTSSFRSVIQILSTTSKTRCSAISHNQTSGPVGVSYILCRYFSNIKLSNGEFPLRTSLEVKEMLSKSRRCRRIHFFSLSDGLSYHSQSAWKRLHQICSSNKPTLMPISRIARAVTLALTRSNLVAPGILAWIFGELTSNQRVLAETGLLTTKNTLYIHAQDGHFYLTSIVVAILEGLILVVRAIYLAILFSPCIVMAPFADSLGAEFRKSWVHAVRVTLEKAGPAFIKWGQWAAARPDLFPTDLCNELAELHSKAPAHSFAYTQKTIEKAFGRKLPEIFDKFEEKPVASGSIAQVHRAILKVGYPRQQVKPVLVAVKVRHPGVAEAIRRDFLLINFFAKISNFIPTLKWLRLDESIQQFAVFMMSQVDLAREAANLNRFIYNFRHWKDVSFPKPLYPFVHPAVLVETYEHGENILHYVDKLEGHQHIRSALAHIGTHSLLKMLLVDNFLHADMHPGNILVRVSQGKSSANALFKSRPHVIFLDVGMTAELSKKDRHNLVEFFKAVAVQDGRAAAEYTLRLSNKQNCPYPEAFIQEVDKDFQSWNSVEDDFQPADCMQQLLEQVRRHKVNIDGNICTVIVTTMVLEGWQHKLDPEYDVIKTLQSLLFKVDWEESLVYTIEGLMAP